MSYFPAKCCRFCGIVSAQNRNLYGIDSSDLLTAAMAVFPMVLYEDDPFPKWCCRKCATQICQRYSDNQRFIELNSRWINRLRALEPNHSYIQLLDDIENAKTDFLNKQKWLQPLTMKLCAARLLNVTKPKFLANGKLPALRAKSKADTIQYKSMDNTEFESPSTSSVVKHRIKNIKSIFEENSCSSVTVGELTIKKTNIATATMNSSEESEEDDDPLKAEHQLDTSDEMDVPLANLFDHSNKMHNCNHCPQSFVSECDLAMHGLQHIRLRMQRIFIRKQLPKELRRGRVIKVEEKKLIRCLICYRIYETTSETLMHWNTGTCDFYCLICGREYPGSPKELRAHVRAAHHVNHVPMRLLHEGMIKPKEEPPVPPVKWRNPILKCNTCGKDFQNIVVLNSHMQMHKTSPTVRDLTLRTNDTIDYNYTELEDSVHIVLKNEPTNDKKTANSKSGNSPVTPKVIVIRGIRTKYNEQKSPNKILKEGSLPPSPISIASAIKPTTPTTQSSPPASLSNGGRIKVKALEELLSTPAKRRLLDDSPTHL